MRSEMRQRLASMEAEKRAALSARACDRLLATAAFERAWTVMIYLALPDELDTQRLALRAFQDGKTVCAPRVDWEHTRMTPVTLDAYDETRFEVCKFSVREPGAGAQPVPIEDLDVVIVPGLAFDRSGYRLGRGEGFYDRFLSQPGLRGAKVFGLCFDFQVAPSVPTSDYDVPMDVVVTELRSLRASAH